MGEVNQKRLRALIIKSQFYIRISNLKSNGQKQETMERISSWLDKNIDYFYGIENMRKKFMAKSKVDKEDLEARFTSKL